MSGIVSALIVSFAFGIALGYTRGKYVERLAWNSLVNDGTIPKPEEG
ncbi:hypothetical protein LCGC14_2264370 [marine sediment metagenome]|uniref:Uncharacterized protein n=1 Tax=marine sediment metagenome TaxID=412755 RepID=A0A0F9CYR9_9ZZZZ